MNLSRRRSDTLRLTRLLRIEGLFGQLMDKSLWFTHWPAIQNVTGQPAPRAARPCDGGGPAASASRRWGGRATRETLFSLAAQMERQSGWLERRAPLIWCQRARESGLKKRAEARNCDGG